MANTWTKGYADGASLTESELDSAYGTVQPSQANLAYSTTGSSANDILVSAGSNSTPNWSTPNTVAATITATGANAILGVVTSCQASVANLIGIAMGSSGANAVVGNLSSCQATVANLIGLNMSATAANFIGLTIDSSSAANNIVGLLSSCQASVTALVLDARTITTGTSAGHLGVAVSASSGNHSSTASSFTDITNLSIDITTNGRPIKFELIPDGSGSNVSYISASDSNTDCDIQIRLYRDSSTAVGIHQLLSDVGSASANFIHAPLGAVTFMDFPAAGTYNYKLQGLMSVATTGWAVKYAKLVAYEL